MYFSLRLNPPHIRLYICVCVCVYTYMLGVSSSAPPRSAAVAAIWSQLFTYLVLPKWPCPLFSTAPAFQACARLAVAHLLRAIVRPTCLSTKKEVGALMVLSTVC